MTGVFPREHMTDDERLLLNHWSFGWTAGLVHKLGKSNKWVVSDKVCSITAGPIFKTKREAVAFVETFILEVIPRRCRERAGLE